MSATLASVATDLETAAGAATSANANEAGYWKRIAAAAEALAGATTTANDNPQGYRLRAALALESIAGTSGAEENANESGYKKRIVDALEVQAGAVGTGSLDYRMMIAAEAAEFGSNGNLVANGTFSSGDNWTLAGANLTIAGGVLSRASGTGTATATQTSGTTLVADTIFKTIFDVTAYTSQSVTFSVGGTNGTARSAVGTYTQFIKTTATNQNFRFSIPSFGTLSVDNAVVYASSGLGDETVSNPTFTTTDGWVLGGDPGVTEISADKLRFSTVGSTGSATTTTSASPAAGTTVFRIAYTIDSIDSGGVHATFAGLTLTTRTTAGTYSEDVVAVSGNAELVLNAGTDTVAVLDTVSVKEILYEY